VPPGSGRRLRNVALAGVVLLGAFVGRRWYDTAPLGRPQFGISYSCAQARYLLGQSADCSATLGAILDGLGARHVRLSLYWNEVEPRPGVFDFSQSDALIAVATAHGADVLLTVGIKAQRYPEVYLPAWLADTATLAENAVLDKQPGVHAAALAFVRAAVQHYANNPTVAAWQVENEPFIKNFQTIHGWTVSGAMTADEATQVQSTDPLRRPVIVTHSAWTIYDQSWKRVLMLGNVLGENVFTKKAWLRPWWYFFPYESGPFTPDLPGQAALARRSHKQLWITELQAEPEEKRSLPNTLDGNADSMTPESFAATLKLARRSGATRVYLWGAEWLYAVRATPRGRLLWEEARGAIDGA
jgi:hypothetical protein